MLTKVDRQTMRDRLAEVEFEWVKGDTDPECFRCAEYVRGNTVYSADMVFNQLGWSYTVTRLEEGGYEEPTLAASTPEYPSAESAKSAASSWLTAYLQPNRADTLALLDWADEVETQLGQLKVVMGDGDYRNRLVNLEATRLYLFGKEADAGRGEPS